MTLLAPIYFLAALGAAAGVVAIHFIVTRQPPSTALPTARFVPQSTVRVVTVSRPRNLLLLLLRVLTILLIGLAFARPVLRPDRRPVARIVLADVSRAVGEIQEVRDSARSLLGDRDVLVAFDDAARVVRVAPADSAARLERSTSAGRLSAGLVAALRTAAGLRAEADSIELAIVSPLRRDEVDGATEALRALWPGRIRIVRVAAGADTLAIPVGARVRAENENDAVALAARLAGVTGVAGDSAVRIVRGKATPEDSAWAAAGRRTLVRWPADGAPPGWRERARPDTVGAVIAGTAALVYPLERRWEPVAAETASVANASSESGSPHAAAPAWRVAARWVDGEPAAVERAIGTGCIRDVAIPVPGRGDLAFRPAFGQLVRALAVPCEAVAGSSALDDEAVERLAGSGPLAPREAIAEPESTPSPLVPWLFALAALLALVELWARRSGGAPVSDDAERSRESDVMVSAEGKVSS